LPLNSNSLSHSRPERSKSSKLSIWGEIALELELSFSRASSVSQLPAPSSQLPALVPPGEKNLLIIRCSGCIDGIGDPARIFVPRVEVFTRNRVPWVPPIEGAEQEIAGFTRNWFTHFASVSKYGFEKVQCRASLYGHSEDVRAYNARYVEVIERHPTLLTLLSTSASSQASRAVLS